MPLESSSGRVKLGQLLVEMGVIGQPQLDQALAEQARMPRRILIGDLLIQLGFTDEVTVARALSRKLGLTYLEALGDKVDPTAAKAIPETMARRLMAIPLYKRGQELGVAMVYPQNLQDIDELGFAARCSVKAHVALKREILAAIDKAYRGVDTTKDILDATAVDAVEFLTADAADRRAADPGAEVNASKLLNTILLQALEQRASDIHLEPFRDGLRVRFRVDGILHETMAPPRKLYAPLVSRIKVMGGMDISERRVPQEGRMYIKTRGGQEIDLRVNIAPTLDGEAVTIRLLDPANGLLDVHQLGMRPDAEAKFVSMVHRPSGLVLATGPTGSGKTSTLYAALNDLNDITRNITTIEDPVEYRLAGINQIQVNRKAGMTFAEGLRSLLRQDPNVILIGEIRDRETAETALEAALTGHLVLSTLHTNDAASAVARLLSLGLDAFIVANALVGVVGQRLVRVLCGKCKQPHVPSPEVLKENGLEGMEGAEIYHAGACAECRFLGYKGRTGIYEILENNAKLQELILQKASPAAMQKAALEGGGRTLWQDGMLALRGGRTSLEELKRVTRHAAG